MKTAALSRPTRKGASAWLVVCLAITVAVATLPAGPAAALSRSTVERQTELERTPWLPDGSATETLQDATASAADPTPTASAAIPLPWLRLALPTLVCDGVLRAENSRLGLGRTGAASSLGRGPPKCRNALGKSARISTNCGGSYDSARYYDPRTSVWQSPDPILGAYMQGGPNGGVYHPRNLGSYTYTWNNPIVLKDPNGLNPWAMDFAINRNIGPQLPADAQAAVDSAVGRAYVGIGAGMVVAPLAGAAVAAAGGSALLAGAVSLAAGGVAGGLAERGYSDLESGQLSSAGTYAEDAAICGLVSLAVGGVAAGAGKLISSVAAPGSPVQPNWEAHNAANYLNLQKQLASEQQMGELVHGPEVIAGAGSPKALRDAPRLSSQYGGSAGEYQKLSSSSYGGAHTTPKTQSATHAYRRQGTNQVLEPKTKLRQDR